MVWVTASLWTEEVEEQVPYSAFAGVYWSWARVMCVCVCVCARACVVVVVAWGRVVIV